MTNTVLAGIALPEPDSAPGLLLASAIVLAILLGWSIVRRHAAPAPIRALLGRLASDTSATVFVRGLFVPANEFFSRAPEYPPQPGGGLTVHKWANIPEVFDAADVRAANEIIQLLAGANPALTAAVRSLDSDRVGWAQNTIAIGPHYKSVLVLDACEPRLVAFRNPDAFRSLISQEVFQAGAGTDFGLVYKGEHPASHKACWVVMGLGDAGTEAAARFLRVNALQLGRLAGPAPFAAIVAVETSRGPETARLRLLHPRPAWWRRLLFRKSWQQLSGAAGPRSAARRA